MGVKEDKRSRSPQPGTPTPSRGGDDNPSRGSASSKAAAATDADIKNKVAAMGTDLTASIMAKVNASNAALALEIVGAITPQVADLAATIYNHEKRMDTIEEQVSSFAEVQAKDSHRIADLEEALKDVQRRLGAAESAEPDASARIIADDIFNQPPNKAILHLECQDIVTKTSALAAATSWLDDLRLEQGAWKLKGRDADRKFVVQFTGAHELAAQRAHKALQLLRNDGGEWRQFHCTTPAGADSRAYINVDKNHKQRRTEMAVRDLSRLMAVELPKCKFTANKLAGLLYCNHLPLAEIKCPDATTTEIWWNNTSASKLPNFNRSEIKARLTQTKTSSDQWSL